MLYSEKTYYCPNPIEQTPPGGDDGDKGEDDDKESSLIKQPA